MFYLDSVLTHSSFADSSEKQPFCERCAKEVRRKCEETSYKTAGKDPLRRFQNITKKTAHPKQMGCCMPRKIVCLIDYVLLFLVEVLLHNLDCVGHYVTQRRDDLMSNFSARIL
jgi:hypothetical protein